MAKVFKGLALIATLLLLLLSAVALALQQWLHSDDFRSRAEAQATALLGVPLELGRLSVELWPLPAIVADQVRLQTGQPLTLARIEARPVWAALPQGRLEIATLIVRDAVLPQSALAAVGAALARRPTDPQAGVPDARSGGRTVTWPQLAVLDRVTWIDGQGRRLLLDAQARLAADGLLERASFHVRQGRFAGARGELVREADHWPLRIDIGGGRILGQFQLEPIAGGRQRLQGELEARGVEVAALTVPHRVLTGKLQAQTRLQAEFQVLGQLPANLVTQTHFMVREAVLHGLDLFKAVQTLGISRGGETPLDELSGRIDSRGSAVQVGDLLARSGQLKASGDVALAPGGALSGKVTVDLAGPRGTLGIPLAVGGTLDAPNVSLSRGALVGAAIGTAVAPGVGTAAGVSLGERVAESLRSWLR